MKTTTILALLGASVASVTATVFQGSINGQNVAYFNGDDMCADNTGLDANVCDVRNTQ